MSRSGILFTLFYTHSRTIIRIIMIMILIVISRVIITIFMITILIVISRDLIIDIGMTGSTLAVSGEIGKCIAACSTEGRERGDKDKGKRI